MKLMPMAKVWSGMTRDGGKSQRPDRLRGRSRFTADVEAGDLPPAEGWQVQGGADEQRIGGGGGRQ